MKKKCAKVMNPLTHHVGDGKEHIFEVLSRFFFCGVKKSEYKIPFYKEN